MKICPKCQKTYADENLNFCLDDGTVLSQAGGSSDMPATVLLNQPRVTAPGGQGPQTAPSGFGQQMPGQQMPGQQMQQGGWNTGQQPNYATPPKKSSKTWLWVLLILGALVLLCGGGFVGFLAYIGSQANQMANTIERENNRTASPSPSNKTTLNANPAPASTRTSVETVDLSKWEQSDKSYGDTDYADGELVMSAKKKGFYYVLTATETRKSENADSRISVRNIDSTATNLGFGLVFHSNPTPLQKGYAFLIDSEKKRYRVVNHSPQKEGVVINWTKSDAIVSGEQNRLEVRDSSTGIDLFINDKKVNSIKNVHGYAGGVVGVYAGDDVKVAFRDLEIRK